MGTITACGLFDHGGVVLRWNGQGVNGRSADHCHVFRPRVSPEQIAVELRGTPESDVGKRVRAHALDPWREVVGIVGEVHDDGLDRPAPATVYWLGLMR